MCSFEWFLVYAHLTVKSIKIKVEIEQLQPDKILGKHYQTQYRCENNCMTSWIFFKKKTEYSSTMSEESGNIEILTISERKFLILPV